MPDIDSWLGKLSLEKYLAVFTHFGWPQASEDDAVRAGLAVISAIIQLGGANGEQLSSRIGIASGVVVVGDLIGSGVSEEATVD